MPEPGFEHLCAGRADEQACDALDVLDGSEVSDGLGWGYAMPQTVSTSAVEAENGSDTRQSAGPHGAVG